MEKIVELKDIVYVSTCKYAPTLGAILELAILSENKHTLHLVDMYEKRYIVETWEEYDVKVYREKKLKNLITISDLSIKNFNGTTKQFEYTAKLILPVSFGITACTFTFSENQYKNGINIKDLILMNRNLLNTQLDFNNIMKRNKIGFLVNFNKKKSLDNNQIL